MPAAKLNKYDVIVAGGGPAGASAAFNLAKNGCSVLVIEKAKLPRYKPCGGGVTFKCLKLIPSSLNEIVEQDCYSAEINDFEANVSLSTKRENPMVLMTMRSQLDYFLLIEAQNFGAEIIDGTEITDIKYSSDWIELSSKKTQNKFYAKILVAADGAFSLSAKKYFKEDHRKLVPAIEYEVYVNDSILSLFNSVARFDFGIVPHGYGWVFPKKDHLSIGVLSMKTKGVNLNNVYLRYLELLQIKDVLKSEKHGFVIPMRPRNNFADGRILLTGDAAGFADPITGEGISYAIISGKFAAESIIKGKFVPERVCREYNIQISENILPELKAARFLATFIYNYPRLRVLIFKLYGKKLSELITDVVMGEKNYTGILKNPLNYIKLFFKWTLRNKKIPDLKTSLEPVQD